MTREASDRNPAQDQDYVPIEDYAVIGNCRTAALVSRGGSLDWLCVPDFSSPSLFAALLDHERGGRFALSPRDVTAIKRRYESNSAVLKTRFRCVGGVAELTEFFPLPAASDERDRLVRIIRCISGKIEYEMLFQPRPDYGRQSVDIDYIAPSWTCRVGTDTVAVLSTDAAHEGAIVEASTIGGKYLLTEGQAHCYVLRYRTNGALSETALSPAGDCGEAATVAWWKSWCDRCNYAGPHKDMVMRSCLTLKLLTYEATGAVMAALTTSLPEAMDADRNWDYRYCWLRDTSLLLQSFIDMGFEDESESFLNWLLGVGRKPRLMPFYDAHGRSSDSETILHHLEGYRGRGPVRVGNAAGSQLQLDIYGELLQTAYRYAARGGRFSSDEKALLVALGDAVCRLWREPDRSIWETRGPPRHHTYSKVMCWVALDRLLGLDDLDPLGLDRHCLMEQRESIRQEIDQKGFSPRLGSYVGYYGGEVPDASLLLMARYGYRPAGDPRMRGTFEAIMATLSRDGLLYRYPPGSGYDGVPGNENLFAVCSFWAVDYLARLGEGKRAEALFERLLGFANDVGLYSEEFQAGTNAALGNFPQAFTHSGVITAAIALEQARRGKTGDQIST